MSSTDQDLTITKDQRMTHSGHSSVETVSITILLCMYSTSLSSFRPQDIILPVILPHDGTTVRSQVVQNYIEEKYLSILIWLIHA